MGNKTIFSNFIWKFMERVAAQVISFAVSVILARILMPEEYGIIAIVNVFIAFADVFIASGISNSLIQKDEVDELDFSTILVLNIGISFLLYIFLYFTAPIISGFYEQPSLILILRILGIRIILSGYKAVQQAYLVRNMLFKQGSIISLISNLFSGAAGILLALCGYGIWALVFQQIALVLSEIILQIIFLKWFPKIMFSHERVSNLFSYGNDIMLSSFLDTLNNQARVLMIGKFYRSSDVAYYNRGDAYPQLLINSINSSLNVVLFSTFSKEQNNLTIVKDLLRKSIKIGTYIVFGILTGLAIVAKPLIVLMLTAKWEECVPYLQIACFSYATWVVQIPNNEVIKGLGFSKSFLKITIIRVIVGLSMLFLSIGRGVLFISLITFVTNLLSTILVCDWSRRNINYSIEEQLKDIAPAMILSIVMACVLAVFPIFISNYAILLFVQVVFGAAVYLAISNLFHLESFLWLKSKIRNVIRG